MTLIRFFVFLFLVVSGTAEGAFEASRSITPSVATYDPLAPRGLFWLANPATLSLSRRRAMAGYARPFRLEALEAAYAGVILHRAPLSIGIALSSLGQASLYRESDLSASLSYRPARPLSLAASVHYLDLRFGERFSPIRSAAFHLGVWFERKDAVGFGVSAGDLFAVKVNEHEVLMPVWRAALSYRYSPPLGLRAGAEYRDRWVFTLGETLLVSDHLHLHADLCTAPVRLLLGGQLTFQRLFFDYTYRDHPDLGGDHTVSLGSNF
jgi:hypothetical protein